MKQLPIALLIICLIVPALAQNTSALINEELDKIVKLDIQKQTIPQAIATIGNATGVRIDVGPGVYDLLPWGEQTTTNRGTAGPLPETLARHQHEHHSAT